MERSELGTLVLQPGPQQLVAAAIGHLVDGLEPGLVERVAGLAFCGLELAEGVFELGDGAIDHAVSPSCHEQPQCGEAEQDGVELRDLVLQRVIEPVHCHPFEGGDQGRLIHRTQAERLEPFDP